MIEIMQHRDDCSPPLIENGQKIKQFDLVGDVKESGRLVEQKDRRFLRQDYCNPYALTLAAGEFVHRSTRKFGDTGCRQCGEYGCLVCLPWDTGTP